MTAKTRLFWCRPLLQVGGVLAAGWCVVSILDLFDVDAGPPLLLKALRALGPLSICLIILAGSLSRWNLPALRKEAEEE